MGCTWGFCVCREVAMQTLLRIRAVGGLEATTLPNSFLWTQSGRPDRHNSKDRCGRWALTPGFGEVGVQLVCQLMFCLYSLTKCCLTSDSEHRPVFASSADVSAPSLSIYTAFLSAENICSVTENRPARLDQLRAKHFYSTWSWALLLPVSANQTSAICLTLFHPRMFGHDGSN